MKLNNLITNSIPGGKLHIGFLGQSGYLIKTEKTTVLIDPYLSDYIENINGLNDSKMKRKFAPPIQPEEIRRIDAVICTHAHLDHMDPWTLEKIPSVFKLYCSRRAFQQNPVNIKKSQRLYMKWDETYSINELKIIPIPAAHYDLSDKNGQPDCLSFIIISNNATLFFWGDGILYDGLIDRLNSYSFDYFFAPINGRDWFRKSQGIIGNLSSRELAELCSDLNISCVIPNHFDMFDYNGENPEHFLNYLNQFSPNQKFRILNHSEIITI